MERIYKSIWTDEEYYTENLEDIANCNGTVETVEEVDNGYHIEFYFTTTEDCEKWNAIP